MTVRFGGIVSHHIGGGWGTETPNPASDTPAYVIRGTDIPRVAVGDLSSVPLRFHKSSNLASRSLQAGDIVFEVSGGSKGQPVGRALYVTDELLARFDHPVMCASFCKLVRIDPELAVPAYVFRDLQLGYRDGRLETFQVQSTGITNFKWKPFLEHFHVSLPPVRVQCRVAEVLTSMDDLIQKNWRRIEVLEEMARAIYREWFVKFRFPGHQDVRLVDSSMGRIPEGWTARKLNGIVSVQSEGVEPASLPPETPAIGLEHIPRRQITLDNWGTAANQGSRKNRFQRGDVLFGKIRPYFHKVSVAPVSGICSTDAIVLRPDAVNWGQAVLTISSDSFVVHATQTSNGTKMPRADWKVLGKWQVAVPPAELAGAFTALARDQLALAETLMFENRRLAELRDRLLPELVTGQIDVSGLDLEAVDAKEEVG